MSRSKLREAIAIEAARLVLRRKESDYATARKRAARWLSRRKLDRADLPTQAEIDEQVYALAGLFQAERDPEALRELRLAAESLGGALAEFAPRFDAVTTDGPPLHGVQVHVFLTVDAPEAAFDPQAVLERLRAAGYEPRLNGGGEVCRLRAGRFDAVVHLRADAADGPTFGLQDLRDRLRASREAEAEEPATDTDDLFAAYALLLARLEDVRLDPERHPEGDALYHSLQVYELGRQERPWDEEFLLACLLHDVGLAFDRRNPAEASVAALEGLVTERTLALVEGLPQAKEALRSGRIPRSLRRSEDGEDLLRLARCDLDGRVPGAEVPELDEALAEVRALETAWDEC